MFKYKHHVLPSVTLTPEGYLPRLAEKQLRARLRTAGAICIEGPKSCGKTWCARNLAESEYALDDPEGGFANLKIAEIDPISPLDREKPRLIDEWQRIPGIWDAVRSTVDRENRSGRFILCNSVLADRPGNSHSETGDIITTRLHTMSLFESGDSIGAISLKGLFDGEFKNTSGEPASLDDLARLVVRGGWPGLLGMPEKDASTALREMISDICGDAEKVDGRRRNALKLDRTFRTLARNESTLVAKTRIASDVRTFYGVEVEEETVAEYLDVLRKLFLTEDQPAYRPDYRSPVKVVRKPKRHLADPSLAVAAIGLDSGSLKWDLDTFESVFEAMCERDLRVYAQTFGGDLYHYRDHSGREIDAVVEIPGKGWGAFGIELGSNRTDDAAEDLKSIDRFIRKDGKAKPPQFLCVISGTEGYAYRRPDGVYVVPICMLGP